MHFCHAFHSLAFTASSTILSRFLLSNTTNASLHPSSKTEGIIYFHDKYHIVLHANSQPVTLAHLTYGDVEVKSHYNFNDHFAKVKHITIKSKGKRTDIAYIKWKGKISSENLQYLIISRLY